VLFMVSKIAWALSQPSMLLISATLLGLVLTHTSLACLGRRLATIAGGACISAASLFQRDAFLH